MRRIAIVWLCVACLGGPEWSPLEPDRAEATVALTPVVQGLAQPVYVTHAGDGSGRLFIVEQAGRIKVLQPGSVTPTVFLDISGDVLSPASGGGSEQGLLSVAFHPTT